VSSEPDSYLIIHGIFLLFTVCMKEAFDNRLSSERRYDYEHRNSDPI